MQFSSFFFKESDTNVEIIFYGDEAYVETSVLYYLWVLLGFLSIRALKTTLSVTEHRVYKPQSHYVDSDQTMKLSSHVFR